MKSIANRLSLAQASSGMATGVFTPFFGVWLAWRGLSAGQITLVLSSGLFLRIFAGPITGILADARNDRRIVMLWLYWAILLGYGILCFATIADVVAATAVAVMVASGVVVPLLESISVRLAERHGYRYGQVRLWASAAFIFCNVAGGYCLWRFGAWVIAPLLGATVCLCIVSTLALPAAHPNETRDVASGLRKTLGETRTLLQSKDFLLLLVTGSLAQGSHAFYYNFGGLHWHAMGYSGMLIGAIWPLGVFAEITILMFAHRLLKALDPAWLLFLGGSVCVLRWTVMAFDPPLAVVVCAQFLHGFTFALSHLGAMFFIFRAVPARLAATAQSLYFVAYSGLVLGVATYASGLIYASFGGRAYLLMSAMGLAAMGCALCLRANWNGKRILQSDTADSIEAV